MACVRVTQDEVLAVMPGTVLTDLSTPLLCANEMVDELAAIDCGSSFSDTKLRCIETYLAAHFAVVSDPTLMMTKEKVEGSEVVLSKGNTASKQGVMSTSFGQQANTLSNGCLQELELMNVSFFVV